MFALEYCFEFKDKMPEIGLIYNYVLEKTNLPIKLDKNRIECVLNKKHISFEYFLKEEGNEINVINVLPYSMDITYFLANVLICLFEYGGTKPNGDYNIDIKDIPYWCNEPYEIAVLHKDFIL